MKYAHVERMHVKRDQAPGRPLVFHSVIQQVCRARTWEHNARLVLLDRDRTLGRNWRYRTLPLCVRPSRGVDALTHYTSKATGPYYTNERYLRRFLILSCCRFLSPPVWDTFLQSLKLTPDLRACLVSLR